MNHSFLFQACIYLAAAVIAVPVAKRLGLGSVLGYLLAGVLVGPHVLGLVGDGAHDGGAVAHFAEFGVVMMLFLIGLELQPSVLWKLRVPILGLGGLQVVATALVLAAGAAVLGMEWKTALAAGLVLSMSSTAIVLQSLQERGWNRTSGGQSAFSVLLFQDIAVIPILALMPLLAPGQPAAESAHGIASFSPGWQALAVLAAVAAVIVGGRFLSRPVFRYIAGARLREVFTAAALFLVAGIALLMQGVGMSPALGAFLGGVVLADNEYRHELESDIEPFKGLLMGLFFVTVGAGVDFPFILQRPLLVLGLVGAVMAAKAAILAALSRAFGLRGGPGLLVALSLSQVGEFAFVLLGLSERLRVLPRDTARLLVAVVALSMLATPPLFLLLDRLMPLFTRRRGQREMDRIEADDARVIIAGFGRMGNLIGRLLRANGVKTTVLDLNPDVVDVVRKVGLKAHYGDASRLDLLHAAGAEKAEVLILVLDNPAKTLEIAQTARRHFPRLKILARARDRDDGYGLVNLGFDHVFRETFGTAMDMGFETLRQLGFRGHQAYRAAQSFRQINERAFRDLARHWGDEKAFLSMLRQKIGEAEDSLRDSGLLVQSVDHAWDNTPLRDAARRGTLKR